MTLVNPDNRSTNRKWLVRCDWPSCSREWWSGRVNPPHYCPTEHHQANKVRRNKEACSRWQKIGKVAGSNLDRRRQRINDAHASMYAPVCAECGESIANGRDCQCSRDAYRRYDPPQVATWRPEREPLPRMKT